jgi:hypothetical protein
VLLGAAQQASRRAVAHRLGNRRIARLAELGTGRMTRSIARALIGDICGRMLLDLRSPSMSKTRRRTIAAGWLLPLFIGAAQGHWMAAVSFAFVLIPVAWLSLKFGLDPVDPADGYASARSFDWPPPDPVRSSMLRDPALRAALGDDD